ncbi:MAG: molybdate ABC transporter substrate-binding protein [Actinomycetes bacterium]
MRRSLVGLALAGLALTGCGAEGAGAGSESAASSPAASFADQGAALDGDITVLAAASLKESFTRLGQQFEQAHPGVHVTYSFGASSQLAQQVLAGAPADVFASASVTNMRQAVDGGAVDAPRNFAANEMTVVTPPSDPGRVGSLADLARANVKLVLCQVQVPCGATAAKVFATAGLTVHPVSEEPDVKATLTKVTLGEADAAVVYVTDARAAGTRVRTVPIPAADNASTTYPIATVAQSAHPRTARAFVDWVLGEAGQQVLRADGFAPAP